VRATVAVLTRAEPAVDPQRSVPRKRSLSAIGYGASSWPATGILVAAHAGRRESTGARSSSREREMLTEPCRSVFMQFGRWIVIQRGR